MSVFLAIDIGTTSTKLSAFDAEGRRVNACSASYSVEFPRAGWAEQDPREWWQAVCRLGPELMASLKGEQVAAISVSGQTPLCAPVDRRGEPLRKAILWLDRRATPQVEWLAHHLGEDRVLREGANRLDSYFGGPKWLWYRQTEPWLFRKTWKIMQANGYAIWRLTGQAVTDPSQAGLCSPCFDLGTGFWNETICHEMDLPVEILPEIHPSFKVVGVVDRAASRATGLPENTPVVCGGGDFACACLGAGVAGRGTAALMLGTAGNLMLPDTFVSDPRLLHTRHVTGEQLTFGGVLAGGNLSWLARLFGEPPAAFYRREDEAAAKIPAGSEGLLYLPYLMGERTPIWDSEARGAFVGLHSRHGRAHLYRATLEGVAFAVRQIADLIGRSNLTSIVAIDGGARSDLWRRIFASILGVPVGRTGLQAGTGLGAAFLGALGIGGVADFGAISAWAPSSDFVEPEPAASRRYEELYPIYAELYPTLKTTFTALKE